MLSCPLSGGQVPGMSYAPRVNWGMQQPLYQRQLTSSVSAPGCSVLHLDSRVFCYTLLTYSTVVNWNPGRGLVNLKRILHSRFLELSYPQSWVFLCNAGGRVAVGALPPSPSIFSVIIWWIATASAGCGFFYAGFFSTWCARIVGQTGVWHRQAISDNSVLVSVYCVLLRILSEGLGTGN